MDQAEKLEALAEIFDCAVDTLRPETRLDALEWDSMAMLSVIALAKAKFNRKIPGAEIRSFKTIQDILNAMACR